MDIHIDWLSFTQREVVAPRTASELYGNARQKLKELNNGTEKIFFDGQGFDPVGGRAPYRVSLARDDNGARVYGASHTETMLYELSGRGCEQLRNSETAIAVLEGVRDRITRLDVAVDIVTDTRPGEFTSASEHARFRTRSHIVSATGETVYVGSPKSHRFCRVYRYHPPHPRAALLRIEFVFRRGLARATAGDYIAESDPATFAAKLGNTFGFNHDVWRPGVTTDDRLAYPIVERKDADSLHWLYSQVAPAVRRLMQSGALDIADWLQYVYSNRRDYQ